MILSSKIYIRKAGIAQSNCASNTLDAQLLCAQLLI